MTHRPSRRRVNHMPKDEAAIAEIKALEDRRYRAMLAGDMAVLDELCSDDLIYCQHHGAFLHEAQNCGAASHASGGPHSGCRWRRAGDRKDDGQGLGRRHDRARRQSLPRCLGARAARLEVCCLPANADHPPLTSIARRVWRRWRRRGERPAPRSRYLPPRSALEVFSALRGRGRGFRTDCMKATAEQDGNEPEIHWTQRSPPPSANHSGRQVTNPRASLSQREHSPYEIGRTKRSTCDPQHFSGPSVRLR